MSKGHPVAHVRTPLPAFMFVRGALPDLVRAFCSTRKMESTVRGIDIYAYT